MPPRSLLAVALLLLALPGAVAVAAPPPQAGAVVQATRQEMRRSDLSAAIVRVLADGRPVVTRAFGTSMTGVPATTAMRFRIGAVSIPYITTVLLQLQDEGRLSLDDPVSRWLPGLPNADRVTLRMLADFTSGYPDYAVSPRFQRDILAQPFRRFSQDELLRYAFATPPRFAPGTGWTYAHTNYVVLGRVLRRVTGRPLDRLIRERVLRPLGLRATTSQDGPVIPGQVLHAYTTERGRLEDSTYWNPSWTLASGAIMTSDIRDMARTATAVGTGELLSPEAFRQMTAPTTVGLGPLTERIYYGVGVTVRGGWILQNPRFAGYSGVAAYLPSRRITIAVATTDGRRTPAAGNPAYSLFQRIAARVAPEAPVPTRP
jgi:CubicO group peptidase (beta-lactamase class C family)